MGEDREGEIEGEEEGEAGKRSVLKMMDPKRPSRAEVEEHELTHLPYRSWCKHCVKGRGKESPHRKTDEQENSMPEVHWDYMFLGEENDPGNSLTVIVGKERSTKMSMSAVVPDKSTGEFLSKRAMAFQSEIGCASGDITVKSDQEAA